MKLRTAFILTGFIILSCGGKELDSFSISGKAEGFPDSTMIILEDRESGVYVDTSYIVGDKFRFQGKVSRPTYHAILVGLDNSTDFEVKYLWIENKELSIILKKGELYYAIVTGSELQEKAEVVDNKQRQIIETKDSIISLRRTVDKSNRVKRDSLNNELDQLDKLYMQVDTLFIREFPNCLHSALLLMAWKNSLPKSTIKSLYQDLSKEIQATRYGITIEKYLALSQKIMIGDSAINFTLPDLQGHPIELMSIQDKYILLEFWGSSCIPCRKENPILLENYLKYRDMGFEIVGVTIDKQKNAWQDAVSKDSMIWITLGDLKGMEGDIPITYNVNYFPKNYLINPDMKIIDTDLRGENLGKKLNEIFSN